MTRPLRIAALLACAILASGPAWTGPISPEQASQHIGETATVEGNVSQVHHDQRSGVTFVNMGGRYPRQAFTGVIFSDAAGQFPGVKSLEGRRVQLTGRIKLYKGKPEMILRQSSQISR